MALLCRFPTCFGVCLVGVDWGDGLWIEVLDIFAFEILRSTHSLIQDFSTKRLAKQPNGLDLLGLSRFLQKPPMYVRVFL